MVKQICGVAAVLLLVGFAKGEPADDLQNVLKKLSDADNYTWTASIEGGGFGGGQAAMTIEGKSAKNGYSTIKIESRGNSCELAMKGRSIVMRSGDAWKTPAEVIANAKQLEGGQRSPEAIMAAIALTIYTPDSLVQPTLEVIENVRPTEGGFTADYKADAVKELLKFRRRQNAMPFEVTNPVGTLKVETNAGIPVKTVVQLSGTAKVNGNERALDRLITTELNAFGTTVVDVPENAKKKLDEVPTTQPT